MVNVVFGMGKELGKDLEALVKNVLVKPTFYAIINPMYGNLSGRLKLMIEQRWPELFNERIATHTSYYFNWLLYAAGIAILDQLITPPAIWSSAMLGLGTTAPLAVVEAQTRREMDKKAVPGARGHSASLLGKVISFMPEYFLDRYNKATSNKV